MVRRSVTTSLCAMRRIARHISLAALVMLCSCSVSEPASVGGRVSIAYLRSLIVDSSETITKDYTIAGRVVANDYCGELSRAFILADESGGIEVKVDAEDLLVDELVPLFSSVELRCSGLYLGRERRRVVLGAEPTDDYVVDRIAVAELMSRIIYLGDSATPPEAARLSIGQIDYDDLFRYVELSDIVLIAEEHNLDWCDWDPLTAQHTTSVRHFTDGRDTISFVTSGACSYAGERIPTTKVRCIGVVDSYAGDIAFRITGYQIEAKED